MKGKRGQAILSSLIYAAVELAIVAMFIAAVLIKVNAAVDDTTYQKRFYARDLALLTDSIMTAEGDFQIEHEIITQKALDVDVQLKTSGISVVDHAKNDVKTPSEISFLFGTNPNIKIAASVSEQTSSNSYKTKDEKYMRSVVLKKHDNTIAITETTEVELAEDKGLKTS